MRSVAYIDLGPSNGGLVLNLSEAGLAFSSAMKLLADQLPPLSFKLPGDSEAIEAQASIVWMSDSRKEAGVQFQGLPEEQARKINDWIVAEQGIRAQLQEAAVSASASLPVPESILRGEQETSHAGPRVRDDAVAREFTPFAVSGLGKTAPLNAGFESVARTPKAASKHKLARYIPVFAALALLAFAAGLTVDHRLPPASAKRLEQAPPVEANDSDNAGTSRSATQMPPTGINSTSVARKDPALAQSPIESADRSDTPVQRAPEPSQRPADSVNTGSKQSTVTGDQRKTESRVKRSTSVTRLDESTSIGEPTNAERRGTGPAPSRGGSLPTPDPPQITSLLANNAKRMQAEAAAEKALEKANEGAASAPAAASTSGGNVRLTPDKATENKDGRNSEASATPPATVPARPPSGSVEVHVPPFPSVRIPPELKSQASTGGQRLQMGQLISRVQPVYPADALSQKLQGIVKAHIAINSEGEVEAVNATGPPLLVETATAALRQWRYKPTLLSDHAIPADADVVVIFRLSSSASDK